MHFTCGSHKDSFNPFEPNAPFLYPQRSSENQRFSNVFKGYGNVTLDLNGLKDIQTDTKSYTEKRKF